MPLDLRSVASSGQIKSPPSLSSGGLKGGARPVGTVSPVDG